MLNGKTQLTRTVDVFGGYNHNARIGEGEFFDMKNMTSDYAPVLAPRKPRGTFLQGGNMQGMIAKDALCWVDGSDFVMNHHPIDLGLSTKAEDCPKQLLSMGAYVIILPDKKYVNTADITDYGNIEARFTTTNPVTFTLCKADGENYAPAFTQPDQPENPGNMQLWVDTSAVPNTLKQWSQSSGMWVSIATTYVKIASPGIGRAFSAYDGVCIRGLSGELTDSASGERIADTSELAALERTAVIQARGDDYIVLTGMLEITRTITNPVTVSREMPAMDFVIERENRLWGCRYGLNSEGRVVNEIYASKLGDFKNWNCFMGISTDSYVVSVGSDGPFTGAIAYGGCPLFWKENCVHKLFGDIPANFGIQTTACRGVQRGSGRSLAIVGELLYYKAWHAVCVYDGALPVELSAALGEERYANAVGGAHGNKYYISMGDAKEQYHLFVYDTAKGLWHKEDALRAAAFCSCRETLYCLEQGTGKLLTLAGPGNAEEKKVSWMVQTGVLGMGLPEQKYVSRILLRLSMELGARLRLFIRYDSMGGWEHIATLSAAGLRSFTFPIRPRRCDHFRLRLEGEGDARIYSMTQTISQGSDRV